MIVTSLRLENGRYAWNRGDDIRWSYFKSIPKEDVRQMSNDSARYSGCNVISGVKQLRNRYFFIKV